MAAVHLTIVARGDAPPWQDVDSDDLFYHDISGDWQVALVEHGVSSGEPSVGIRIDTDYGPIIIEQTLNMLIAITGALRAGAETRFGWVQQP